MILLKDTTETLEILTSASVSIDYSISFVDVGTAVFTPSTSEGNIATATTTSVVSAPSAALQRQIKLISVRNRSSSAAQQVTFKKDISGTEYWITPTYTLGAGEMLQYMDGDGWKVLGVNGAEKLQPVAQEGYTGNSVYFFKTGTAAEAAGNFYCWAKDAGLPGVWAPGTPGLTGRATDGTAAPDAGCLPYKNATSGINYLTRSTVSMTVAGHFFLKDVLWVNSGIVVTNVTAQTINSVAFPARDMDGSSDGRGVGIGLLVTTATTNAALIANMTVEYTNSAGTPTRTATVGAAAPMAFPQSAVIGTFVPFFLHAGDEGVRSIQSITLGTSLLTGAVSLIAYRVIDSQAVMLANIGGPEGALNTTPGVRLYDGSCMLPFNLASATTATTVRGTINIMER